MTIKIELLTFLDAMDVAERMRERDREEIFACRWNDSTAALAADSVASAPLAWCARIKKDPVAAYGLSQVRPGVLQAWLYATDRFDEVGKAVTRHIKSDIQPALAAAGIHRIECHSLAGHDAAHHWLQKSLDAVKEADHPGFGRRKELFHTFAWVSPDVRPEHPQG